jgi:hypothetical protein
MKGKNTKGRVNKKLKIVLLIILTVAVVFSSLFFYIFSYRNVYAIVKGTKIYNSQYYYEAVKEAERLNYLGYDPLSSDPKMQSLQRMLADYAKNYTISERLYYLMGVQDGFTASNAEIEKALEDYENNIIKGSSNPEKDFQDELKSRGLTEKDLRSILAFDIIATKEKDKLTEKINVSESDLKAYFNEWGSAYGANGKNDEQVYKNNYERIKQDAINMKKSDYLDNYSRTLIADNVKYISMDNVYKKFMRWYYQNFLGLSVPYQYQASN